MKITLLWPKINFIQCFFCKHLRFYQKYFQQLYLHEPGLHDLPSLIHLPPNCVGVHPFPSDSSASYTRLSAPWGATRQIIMMHLNKNMRRLNLVFGGISLRSNNLGGISYFWRDFMALKRSHGFKGISWFWRDQLVFEGFNGFGGILWCWRDCMVLEGSHGFGGI